MYDDDYDHYHGGDRNDFDDGDRNDFDDDDRLQLRTKLCSEQIQLLVQL